MIILTLKDIYNPDEDLIIKIDDNYELDENLALAELLQKGIVFPNTFDYYSKAGIKYGTTTTLFVECNDVFYWAHVDSQPFKLSDLTELYLFHRTDPDWGSAMWCCKQRDMRPQEPVEEKIRLENIWGDFLDSLPERDSL